MRNEEFQEEDIWSVLSESKAFNSKIGTSKESSSITSRRLPAATRMIPRNNYNSTGDPKLAQQSAPVHIPDWSKIYGKSPKASKNASWLHDDDDDDGDGGIRVSSWDSDEYDDGGDDGDMMPPHEWIAKKLARTQISSFSVCEGVGRTLKGRDLSRVRNAVLTRTGFLE